MGGLAKTMVAVTIFFGLLAAVPIVTYYLLSREDSKPGLVEFMSLYGYSFTVYIPWGCHLSISDRDLQVGDVISRAGWSSALMFKNYRREFEGTGGWSKWGLAGLVLLGHVGIILAGNLYFFS